MHTFTWKHKNNARLTADAAISPTHLCCLCSNHSLAGAQCFLKCANLSSSEHLALWLVFVNRGKCEVWKKYCVGDCSFVAFVCPLLHAHIMSVFFTNLSWHDLVFRFVTRIVRHMYFFYQKWSQQTWRILALKMWLVFQFSCRKKLRENYNISMFPNSTR
jgi:hypothetical protein